MFNESDQLAVNALRALSVEQIEQANSGHPGLPLGAAPMAYALFANHLHVDPEDPHWFNRDRFVLSAGHGSALLYSLLHMSGYPVSLEDLKAFRQTGSKTPGHPEVGHTVGVEATTGPLGQGLAQAVGMAMAEAHLAGQFSTETYPLVDHYTYALVSDGDLMEGVGYEAASFAGHQQLGKLILLYDSNDICLDGDLDETFTEDIQQRFESMGWHYQRVEDGNDLEGISQAIQKAKEVKSQPSIIEVKTIIGFGAPDSGTHKVHGSPLGEAGWQETKKTLGWDYDSFEVPQAAYDTFKDRVIQRGQAHHQAWKDLVAEFESAEPERASQFKAAINLDLPADYDSQLVYQDSDEKGMATRNASQEAITALTAKLPFLWGGSADLSGSNKTRIHDGGEFMPDSPQGRNIWFGVREFAMAAMANGALLHGGNRIFTSTFFVFSDYLKPAVRLAALSELPQIFVLTHDSVAVGEDGPTHEPIEQLAAFRATPNLTVIRPADVNETFAAWKVALESKNRPTMLVLTRQNVPTLKATKELAEEGVRKGAYVISPSQGEKPEGILIATGSEVDLAIQLQARLSEEGYDLSVVSMPSQDLFDQQDPAYKESVLPAEVTQRMSIEMAASYGWERYVGLGGKVVGLDRFGLSGPAEEVMETLGFSLDQLVDEYKTAFPKDV